MIILALLKLWLVAGQSVSAITHAGHDDRLFLNIAQQLLFRAWLGEYNVFTLIKGPFYPLWIAFSFIAGTPLLLSQHLLYIMGCFVFALAVKPIVNKPIYTLVLFTFLLFNPISFANGPMTRIGRSGIYPALTLIVVACTIGFMLRQGRQKWSTLLIWAVGLGISLASFWLTREEGVWLIPMLAIIIIVAAYRLIRDKPDGWRMVMALWAAALVIWISLVAFVSGLNYRYYGLFAKTEMDAKAFKSAYGALSRVKPDDPKRYVPVTKQTRTQIYKASPAFRELETFLEGSVGEKWAAVGPQDKIFKDEILAAWFMWAFRDAVAEAGYYKSGRFPEEYYQRLADEINAACENGQLECYPQRATFQPVWRNEYWGEWVNSSIKSLIYISRFDGFSAIPSPSSGPPEGGTYFKDLTREEISEFPNRQLVQGWAFKDEAPVHFRITSHEGHLVDATYRLESSKDVYLHFLSEGKDISAAKHARFAIEYFCEKGCFLEVWDGDELIERFPVVHLKPQFYEKDGLYLNVEANKPLPLLLKQHKLIQHKLNLLNKIGRLYQIFIPYLAVLALVSYIYLCWKALFKRKFVDGWVILTTLLAGIVSLVLVLSLVETTSFPVINILYLSPVYPLLMAFIMLSVLWYLDDILKFLRKHYGF